MLITASYWSSNVKHYSFRSVLVGVIFSQASLDIPEQVTDLISWCGVKIHFQGTLVFKLFKLVYFALVWKKI